MNDVKMFLDSLTTMIANAISGSVLLFAILGIAGVSFLTYVYPIGMSAAQVPTSKHFTLHNYVSSEEASQLLQEDPDILFIDVRDTLEVAMFGHPEPIDAIVPVRLQTDVFDEALQEYVLADNPEFLAQMDTFVSEQGKGRDSLIIITCGSGYRSAMAAEILATAGYTNVWHIPDGYVGDHKPGLNTQNAWQLAGLAWSN